MQCVNPELFEKVRAKLVERNIEIIEDDEERCHLTAVGIDMDLYDEIRNLDVGIYSLSEDTF